MALQYALVSEAEDDEPIELPTEEDGALLLSTVRAQFAAACGLKYRDRAAGGRLRGLRLVDERLSPPPQGWAAHRYFCAVPRRAAPHERPRCSDLIVLGLPWKTGEEAVREYFEAFGELLMVQVKRDLKTGLSKGFGFIKFAEQAAQARALGRRHMIEGRWCDVRVPHSKEGGARRGKVFVGRCTEALSADDLRDYFAHFGQVTDVFIPKPFRAFSFVTFLDPEVAQSLCGQDHIVKGVSVNVSTASPKREREPAVGGAGPGVAAGAAGAAMGWGLLDGGGRALFNWPGESWPPHTLPPTGNAPAALPPPDQKPYLKYE